MSDEKSICKCGAVIELLDNSWFHVNGKIDEDHAANPVEIRIAR